LKIIARGRKKTHINAKKGIVDNSSGSSSSTIEIDKRINNNVMIYTRRQDLMKLTYTRNRSCRAQSIWC